MGSAEGLLTGRTADTQARRWEPVQVPLGDLGGGLVGMGAPQRGAPDAGRSRRATRIATGSKRIESGERLNRTAPIGRFSSSSRENQAAGRATATSLFPSGSRR
jgi:hypothetical protein